LETALITGVAGQDGSYLAEFLLQKGYSVFGFKRSGENVSNIEHIKGKISLIDGDLANSNDVLNAVQKSMPDEIYNLAAISHVVAAASADNLESINVGGVKNILEAVKKFNPKAKIFQASSAEIFGGSDICPQNEQTPFAPVSAYAKSKVEAHNVMQAARKESIFAACGILYNHESPRRPVSFVTRKITSTVARISKGSGEILKLGNLNAVKDWGFAGDYVKAMHLVLQQEVPDDFIIGTGERHTVRDFVNAAFAAVNKKIEWRGSGVDEKGYSEGKLLVEVDPQFFRPVDTKPTVADASKIRNIGWKPEVSFAQLVKLMVDADLKS
jgi:GDPmannose 4,6-dehydratase